MTGSSGRFGMLGRVGRGPENGSAPVWGPTARVLGFGGPPTPPRDGSATDVICPDVKLGAIMRGLGAALVH